MEELAQAHHELDRLQGIITRHEGFMFTLRGWLLTVVGALLAVYYTGNVQLGGGMLRGALLIVTAGFFVVETRHANLVEAVSGRALELERRIIGARGADGTMSTGWYEGPLVSEVCKEAAERWIPRSGMTFALNRAFYLLVILLIVVITLVLPPRRQSDPEAASWRGGISHAEMHLVAAAQSVRIRPNAA